MTTLQTPTETTMNFIQREREKFYEDTKDMTKDEVMAYIHEGSAKFRLALERRRAERLATDKK